ncbi:MAG: aldehyde ferredoxin oxidoreductase family protein [Acidobacteriota bacterium]
MQEVSGTNNRILEINVTKRSFKIITIPEEDRKKYLGGKGLALKLLYDRLTQGTDPLGEDNIFIVTTGVLIGTGAPNSSRFSAVTKSPLTGIITSSSCGGPFGNALKTSGWDGIIVRGSSADPIYLNIDSSGVKFIDCTELWGKTTGETSEIFEKEGGGSLVIGPAGENGVLFANVASGSRFLGRGGMGAVLGSKKIKAIVAKGGEFRIVPRNKDKFKKISKRGFKFIKKNYFTSVSYNKFGTLWHTSSNNDSGILPVRNFSDGRNADAYRISGEYVRENHKTSFHSCKNCTILCGHKGEFNGKITKVPEYETTALLGSNLGIFDIEKVSEWNDICNEMGMDTISTGGTLSYVMEAVEKGLISYPLKFSSPDNIKDTLYDIAHKRGFGAEIALGSRNLSRKYGGREFAVEVKGLEISGYDPRGSVGMGLNYAVANKGGCHLSSAVFGLEIVTGYLNPGTTKNKAFYVSFLENIFPVVNSLHTCQFTIYPYILEALRFRYLPAPIVKICLLYFPKIAKSFFSMRIYSGLFSAVTGINLSDSKFIKAGERIHILERYMNTREGIRKKDDSLPEKLLKNTRESSKSDKPLDLNKMLKKYYKIKKYDKDGIPTKKILKKLDINTKKN